MVRVWRVRGERDLDLALPAPATPGSAGADLRACLDEPLCLEPGQRRTLRTGIALAIPEGFEGQVRPRSGLARDHGVTCLNAPGTIDSDYRGEVHVILHNAGDKSFEITRGDRIAQLVIAPIAKVEFALVESPEALGNTGRGSGGFGHTGR